MADVTITPPPQSLGMGTQPVIIKAQPDSRFILAFPVDQAIIERPEDSDSLVFTFSDGSMVEIEGFYEQYTKDNL
ncbi:MAG: hypothetical protein LBR31_01515, partial [Desulfovibrio sp.]|nr:hypothetical protein [Desulfovibrio sp.]